MKFVLHGLHRLHSLRRRRLFPREPGHELADALLQPLKLRVLAKQLVRGERHDRLRRAGGGERVIVFGGADSDAHDAQEGIRRLGGSLIVA